MKRNGAAVSSGYTDSLVIGVTPDDANPMSPDYTRRGLLPRRLVFYRSGVYWTQNGRAVGSQYP